VNGARLKVLIPLIMASSPLLPASDPFGLRIFPGGSLLVGMFTFALLSAMGTYLAWHRYGRWWGLAATLLAGMSLALSLTTLQFLAVLWR